jgi:hypothetical protein
MIELNNDSLSFDFPEVDRDAQCSIKFQRTLRIPDDNQEYPLPPGLGTFPLSHVDDHSDNVPEAWKIHGGVFLPMYQAEAMWINFDSDYPFAIKIAAGKINAVTGNSWRNELSDSPQDYVVIPSQPWLDGFCVSKGSIRQFVAMPLGNGYSAEEQLTGKAEHGGIQIIAYPMKRSYYEELQKKRSMAHDTLPTYCMSASNFCDDMGLSPGGLMRQEIYDDEYGIDAWDQSASSRCFVHIANSTMYSNITGTQPPTQPPSAQQYNKAGLPWFDYYDTELKTLKGAEKLAGLDSVAAKTIKQQMPSPPDNSPLQPNIVINLKSNKKVREENF